jgi:hypothetical protein
MPEQMLPDPARIEKLISPNLQERDNRFACQFRMVRREGGGSK